MQLIRANNKKIHIYKKEISRIIMNLKKVKT